MGDRTLRRYRALAFGNPERDATLREYDLRRQETQNRAVALADYVSRRLAKEIAGLRMLEVRV